MAPATLVLAVVWLCAQVADPARQPLEKAYEALRAKNYESAIAWFGKALEAAPERPQIRKDLAYTYLKIGEPEAARDQFAEAMRLDPSDSHVALEYAFLCFETKQRATARRVFDRLRRSSDPAARATAEQAFQNIDRPLAEGIQRWKAALASSPDNFSGHQELAVLAEQRDELELAAEHYAKALQLRPDEPSLLLDLARVFTALSKTEQAQQAYLAASRSSVPRVAEAARQHLPARQQQAPDSATAPASPRTSAQAGAKEMAERSYRKGYLKDALRYLKIAHEADPADSSVILKMGWTYNALRQDEQALRWFQMARKSPDPSIAREAGKACKNLRQALARTRTTLWLFPFYSSRWKDVFSYGQLKTEFKLGRLPFRPYLSTRFIGDTRRTTGEVLPQYLSESSFLFALGLATRPWHGLTLWGEAGTAVSYLARQPNLRRATPDYRGGAAYSKGFGQLLGGEAPGAFFETNDDAVFVSRFQNDLLFYSQNRFGYTLPRLGGLRTQLYWNSNVTLDLGRQYWANFLESGPGLRFRLPGMPEALTFSVNLLRGAYLLNRENPQRPNFFDIRAGFWYALTR
jgi:Tfp pilus assembly protein PilF